jgi:hypothetical protein
MQKRSRAAVHPRKHLLIKTTQIILFIRWSGNRVTIRLSI